MDQDTTMPSALTIRDIPEKRLASKGRPLLKVVLAFVAFLVVLVLFKR